MNVSHSSALLLLLSSNAHVAFASGIRGDPPQSIEKERATPGVSRLEAEMDELVSEANDRDLKADNAELKSSIEVEAIEETPQAQGTAMTPVSVNEPGDDEEHQWPLLEDIEAQEIPFDFDDVDVEHGHGRELGGSDCAIWADGYYFHPKAGECYNLGGTWWNDKVTWIRASSGTCVEAWEHHGSGSYQKHCGSDWLELGSNLSREVSRVCCPAKAKTSPVTSCTGNGGACGCGKTSDGHIISMNRYWGDWNDEKVWGCGGAFHLSGATWNSQWGGTLSQSGAEANVLHSAGVTFSQGASFDGWEGCCMICGYNLQMAGKISDGWYCEKDFFSTGIWLKGKHK